MARATMRPAGVSPRRRSPRVLVVAPPPDAALVPSPGRAVEPLVHAPETVQAARVGGIRVVDDAVLADEGAHARSLARVRGDVRADHPGADRWPGGGRRLAAASLRRLPGPVVVFEAALALLLLG